MTQRPHWLTPEQEALLRQRIAEYGLHTRSRDRYGRYKVQQDLGVTGFKATEALRYIYALLLDEEGTRPPLDVTPGNTAALPDPSPSVNLTREETVDGKRWILSGNYHFDEAQDVYLTYLRVANATVRIPGEKHRAMKAAYSNWDGAPQTINQITKNFGMPRAWFNEYKAKHGWTHDSEPFTDEEMMARDEGALVNEALQMKRLSLTQRFEAERHAADQRDAEKWRRQEEFVIRPLEQALSQHVPSYAVPHVTLSIARNPFAAVIPAYDMHFGRGSWQDETGAAYSRDSAARLLTVKMQEILEDVAAFGAPQRFLFPIGSDFFNADTSAGTTTGGTAQDNDGSLARIITEGCELLATQIDLLRQIAPVELVQVCGNHDRIQTVNALLYLKAWFRTALDVSINPARTPRVYVGYANNLLGFTHGDGAKFAELPGLMASEAREEWGRTAHHQFFTGHLHHEVVRDLRGATLYQVPSLAGADRWSALNGHTTSRRGLQAFLVDAEKGVRRTLTAPVSDVPA